MAMDRTKDICTPNDLYVVVVVVAMSCFWRERGGGKAGLGSGV
jgi:hypothetical protein